MIEVAKVDLFALPLQIEEGLNIFCVLAIVFKQPGVAGSRLDRLDITNPLLTMGMGAVDATTPGNNNAPTDSAADPCCISGSFLLLKQLKHG